MEVYCKIEIETSTRPCHYVFGLQ